MSAGSSLNVGRWCEVAGENKQVGLSGDSDSKKGTVGRCVRGGGTLDNTLLDSGPILRSGDEGACGGGARAELAALRHLDPRQAHGTPTDESQWKQRELCTN